MKKSGAATKQILSVFWYGAKTSKRWLVIIPLAVTFANLGLIGYSWSIKLLFDALESGIGTSFEIESLYPVFGLILTMFAVEWTSWRVAEFANFHFQPFVMKRLELLAFERILQHDYKFFADNFAGSLIKKVGRLSRGFEKFADEITFKFVPVIVTLIGTVIALALQFPMFAITFVAWCTIFFIIQYFMTRWSIKADLERTEQDSVSGGVLSDAISNALTIKTHATTNKEYTIFEQATDKLARLQLRSWRRHSIIFAAQATLMMLLEFTLIYYGVNLWIDGVLSLGDLVFIQSYLGIVFQKVWDLSRGIRHISEALVDAEEMVTIINTPTGITDIRGAKPLRVTKGAIAFSKVSFGFSPKKQVLTNLSLSIEPKQKIALVGPSGAGKSTLTKLLLRFFDIQKGMITIDRHNIAKVTQDSLRNAISIVPQDPILFHRSLLDNIRYGKQDATMEEVIEAAKKAHCHKFISALKDGYDTFVGERGVKLSGGERQRVAIARAILRNAPILVLDEATSALDSQSEQLIQAALRELMKNKTVIVIAHRLSTIMMMDKIVVIENGKITDTGTHAELLKNRGTYNKLWELQAGAFE